MTILSFIVALGLLVFIHEWGHFLAAKKQGIGVEKFSLGFGPKLLGVKRGETTYLLSALPLGGYVKLKGEEPDSAEASDPTSYSSRPVSHRFLVVLAGPVMNLILAVCVMPLVFLIGRMEPAFLEEPPVVLGVRRDSPAEKAGLKPGDTILTLDGRSFDRWKDVLSEVLINAGREISVGVRRGDQVVTLPVTLGEDESSKAGYLGVEPPYFIGNEAIIDEVMPGSPAEEAGVKVGDLVVSIDRREVQDWIEMSGRVQEVGGRGLLLEIEREGRRVALRVTPRLEEDRWLLGVRKDLEKRGPPMVARRYGLLESVDRSFSEIGRLSQLTFSVLGRLVTFQLSYKTLGGPIRIAQAAGMAARASLSDFVYFLSFLSLQLGLLNLLPIPVLDGGHLLFLGIERLIRRPVRPRIRLAVEQAGLVLLLTLMVLITWNDVDSIWGWRRIVEGIRGIF